MNILNQKRVNYISYFLGIKGCVRCPRETPGGTPDQSANLWTGRSDHWSMPDACPHTRHCTNAILMLGQHRKRY